MNKRNVPPSAVRSHIKMPANIRKKLRDKKPRQDASTVKRAGNSWVSPDGEYCNNAYAADFLGRSISRLQSMRCEGAGPVFLKRGRAVYYRVADLKAYLESGVVVSGVA